MPLTRPVTFVALVIAAVTERPVPPIEIEVLLTLSTLPPTSSWPTGPPPLPGGPPPTLPWPGPPNDGVCDGVLDAADGAGPPLAASAMPAPAPRAASAITASTSGRRGPRAEPGRPGPGGYGGAGQPGGAGGRAGSSSGQSSGQSGSRSSSG